MAELPHRLATITQPMTMTAGDESTNQLPDTDDGSLAKAACFAVGGLIAVGLAAYFGTQLFTSDHYVVDFYPSVDDSSPVLVIRWPSQQMQLAPITLPKVLGEHWTGKQPKRARLSHDTILPAGDVLEYDESSPPGRFLLRISRQEIEVSPDSPWARGERAFTQP